MKRVKRSGLKASEAAKAAFVEIGARLDTRHRQIGEFFHLLGLERLVCSSGPPLIEQQFVPVPEVAGAIEIKKCLYPLAHITLNYHSFLGRIACHLSSPRNQSRDISRLEAAIDIHDDNVGRAAIEHGKQRGDAAEGGAVADAGRHGDDRTLD